MTNKQIYEYAQNLSIFNNCDIKMPVRINFYLQKNIQILQQAADEIDKARMQLGAQYGTPNSAGNGYNILPEHVNTVNQELNDLFTLEQELNIHIFKLSDFDGIDLEYQQMSAILFMIEE